MLAGLLCLLVAGGAFAGDREAPPGDPIALLADVEPVELEVLAEARGGASLPGDFGIEVTAVLRLLAEGQDLVTMTGSFVSGQAPVAPMTELGAHANLLSSGVLDTPVLVNSLDGVSLEQYREVTIHLTNLPTRGVRVPSQHGVIGLGATGH